MPQGLADDLRFIQLLNSGVLPVRDDIEDISGVRAGDNGRGYLLRVQIGGWLYWLGDVAYNGKSIHKALTDYLKHRL